MSSTAWVCNPVAKAAKVASKAARVAPVAAPMAGGLGFILLGLGAVWAISKVKGPIEDIYKGAEAVVRAPGEFGAGLFTGREEVPITKYQFDPDVPTTHFTVTSSGVTVTNPSPNVPPPVFYEVPSATRQAGIYVRGSLDFTGDPFAGKVPGGPEFHLLSPFTGDGFSGKVPGGPEFDLLAPFRGLFGGGDEPQVQDLLYRGEPTETVNLPFKGERLEMFYL